MDRQSLLRLPHLFAERGLGADVGARQGSDAGREDFYRDALKGVSVLTSGLLLGYSYFRPHCQK